MSSAFPTYQVPPVMHNIKAVYCDMIDQLLASWLPTMKTTMEKLLLFRSLEWFMRAHQLEFEGRIERMWVRYEPLYAAGEKPPAVNDPTAGVPVLEYRLDKRGRPVTHAMLATKSLEDRAAFDRDHQHVYDTILGVR